MGVCRRYVKNIEEAEDIVQNTFEVAIQKIETFKGIGSFEGWLKRIATNQCIQFLKEQKQSLVKFENYKYGLSADMIENNLIENKRQLTFTVTELLEVIDQLPDHHKLVFNLYVLDGYKHHQIAEMLNITVNTSKSHLSRARKKAQTLLIDKTHEEHFTTKYHKSWLLLLFLRFDMVDVIFRKSLANFTIPSGKTPSFITNASSVAIPGPPPFLCKLGLYVGLFSAVTGIVFFVVKKNNQQPTPLNEQKTILVQDTLVKEFKDTLVLKEEEVFSEDKKSIEKKPQVIVRKKIIVRDTVYVKKPR